MAVRTGKSHSDKARRFGSRAAIAEESEEVKRDTRRIPASLDEMPSTHLSTGSDKALRSIVNLGNSFPMNGQGIDQAIARIEAALVRIGAAAEALPANSSASADASTMRQEVAGTLKQLDALIESLEG